ncbi:MAG: phosphatidylglycerophosphatase A [Candidatus Dadabacteria bacterium]|nr:phosphatidylglycerophosphatase A [Candidatus Dadabacteria bacterium]
MKPVRALASLFGLGYIPFAPGTFGTVGAAGVYALFLRHLDVPQFAVFCLVFTAAAVFVCDWEARALGAKDPQTIVMDEAAGFFWTAMFFSSGGAVEIASGVVLFRLFDITKPFPSRRLENLPGGWGIVLDDVYAGILAGAGVFALGRAGVAGFG